MRAFLNDDSVGVVEGLVGGEEDLEMYPVFNWEPVKVMGDWGDVVTLAGTSK